jgi:hypothetical protein
MDMAIDSWIAANYEKAETAYPPEQMQVRVAMALIARFVMQGQIEETKPLTLFQPRLFGARTSAGSLYGFFEPINEGFDERSFYQAGCHPDQTERLQAGLDRPDYQSSPMVRSWEDVLQINTMFPINGCYQDGAGDAYFTLERLQAVGVWNPVQNLRKRISTIGYGDFSSLSELVPPIQFRTGTSLWKPRGQSFALAGHVNIRNRRACCFVSIRFENDRRSEAPPTLLFERTPARGKPILPEGIPDTLDSLSRFVAYSIGTNFQYLPSVDGPHQDVAFAACQLIKERVAEMRADLDLARLVFKQSPERSEFGIIQAVAWGQATRSQDSFWGTRNQFIWFMWQSDVTWLANRYAEMYPSRD